MKHIVLTLSLIALLFNAAVAQAVVHSCNHHEAVTVEQTVKASEKAPCHTEKQATEKAEQTAEKSCCGDVCLCLAKATLKTIDAPLAFLTAAALPSQTSILGKAPAALDADLFAENPPPKLFV